MQKCQIVIDGERGRSRHMLTASLSDFNRMRWAVGALRCNPFIIDDGASTLLDSTALLNGLTPVPHGSHIVLWDGINSLIELEAAVPSLVGRHDLRYLYVGRLPETVASFPERSQPLFPSGAPDAVALKRRDDVHVPAWFGIQGHVRATLRPLRNRRISQASHQALARGGQLVFCGAVRPTAAILDAIFMGTHWTALRREMTCLEGLEWRYQATNVEVLVCRAFSAILATDPKDAAEAACLYALLNTLHRLGTLAILSARSSALLVNEYGYQTHLDPYDAYAYRRNLFVDFGSTRGPDLCYPRTVDLALTRKPFEQLRLLAQDQTIQGFLGACGVNDLWSMCESGAKTLISRQIDMFAV
jgi:hypothetical protein